MPRYTVIVNTIEHHTRQYEVEADDENDARNLVYDGMQEYQDSFEGIADDDASFEIVEVVEELEP